MSSSVTRDFRELLLRLPPEVQIQARAAFSMWRSDPRHPSIQFKRVSKSQPIYAARVGLGYRALGIRDGEHIDWFWIGAHAEYDALLKRL